MKINKQSSLNSSNINVKKSELSNSFSNKTFFNNNFKSEDKLILSKQGKQFSNLSREFSSPEEKLGFAYLYKSSIIQKKDITKNIDKSDISVASNSIFNIWKKNLSDSALNTYSSKLFTLLSNQNQNLKKFINTIHSLLDLPKNQLEANIITISKKI